MGRISRFRRWAIIVIAVGTTLWAAAQLTAGIIINNDPWPVTGFPMFKNTRTVAYHTDLFVRTQSGQTKQLGAEDFNIAKMGAAFHHLYRPPTRGHAPVAAPGAKARLGRVIGSWNRDHPDDPAVSARIRIKVFSLAPKHGGLFATRAKRTQVYQPLTWP